MTTLDSWPKTLPMPSAQSWNSTTETHLLPRHKNSLFCFLGVSTFKSNDYIVLLLIIFNLLFQDSIIHSICSTHDIDFFCHMNNAKYFKELDFARFDFYFRSELSDYVEARKEIYVVQHAAMIIYRRPLNFLMPFIVIFVKPK